MFADTHSYRRSAPHTPDLGPTEVIPFGRYGAGLITAHPVGLVVALGMLFMSLAGLPPTRLFFATSFPLGGVWGLFLWLRHR
jgi:hypothetical protein